MRPLMWCIGLFGLLAFAWTQGTAFTYQGLLKQSGTPVNANHDFQFSLWTTASGATQVGSTLTLMNVLVQNGLFTVSLDFGAVWDGSDRYLQIAVRPAGSGSYTTLSPRVKINPTPYAIRAGSLTLPFSGSANVPSGAVVSVTNTALSGETYGVFGQSASTSGRGVFGWASATSGETAGGWFHSDSQSGRGVFGFATATTGSTYGGYFWSRSTSGVGVFGWASASSGNTWGVLGESASTSGRGVHGLATAPTGPTYGGYFENRSPDGFGVLGLASATSGVNAGVLGMNASTGGRAVHGVATATVGTTHGGHFVSRSFSGVGVFGWASHETGGGTGVWGESASASGIGGYFRSAGRTGAKIVSFQGLARSDWFVGAEGGLEAWDIVCNEILASSYLQRSDERLKRDIQPLNAASELQRLLSLRPVSYYWRDEGMSQELQYGFIAQELREVFPELVLESIDEQKTLSVNYQALIPLLVNALRAQEARIQRLEAELERLRAQKQH